MRIEDVSFKLDGVYLTAWHAYYHKNVDYMHYHQQCEYQQKLVVYTVNEIKTIDSLILEMGVNKNRTHRRDVYVLNASHSLLTNLLYCSSSSTRLHAIVLSSFLDYTTSFC